MGVRGQVWKRVWKMTLFVWIRVRIRRTGWHTPTKNSQKYPPGVWIPCPLPAPFIKCRGYWETVRPKQRSSSSLTPAQEVRYSTCGLHCACSHPNMVHLSAWSPPVFLSAERNWDENMGLPSNILLSNDICCRQLKTNRLIIISNKLPIGALFLENIQ